VPCAERVVFTCSGSEAVQLALRLGRGATGRNLIVKFDGHYHGWLDSVLIDYRTPGIGSKGQVPNAVDNVVVAEWNNLPQLEQIFAEHSIAAVITEPVLCNSGCLMPEPGYLAALRELTRKHGALLIFDEVITGFRMSLGGAQEYFGVTPDLATFGKAVAGGVPLSVVAGRADVMELMLHGGVVFGGTFNGNPLAMAAAKATLDTLSADNGAALKHANRMGEKIRDGLREMGLLVTGFGTAFSPHFTSRQSLRCYRDVLDDDKQRLESWIRGALDQGIYLLPDGRLYTSAAHTEREVDETLAAARNVLSVFA
jgi:glutamate-1-semialdehyde 2,1-aminomutase